MYVLRTHTHIHTHMHTPIHSRTRTACICTLTHTLIHSYTHTLIHSYTHPLLHLNTQTLIQQELMLFKEEIGSFREFIAEQTLKFNSICRASRDRQVNRKKVYVCMCVFACMCVVALCLWSRIHSYTHALNTLVPLVYVLYTCV